MSSVNLVLLPGLLNDARLWQHQITGLADLAQISVADLKQTNTIPALAAAVVAAIPPGPFAIAGLSMGGYVAFEIMRQVPERVLALALLDTTARADTTEGKEGRRKLMQQAESEFPAVVQTLLPKMVHPTHLDDPAIGGIFTAMALDAGKAVFTRQQEAIMGRVDSRPLLGQIKCPTLVLCGRDDAITPVAVHEEMAAGIPQSILKIIDECGHLSPLGQTSEVTAALKKWLLNAIENRCD